MSRSLSQDEIALLDDAIGKLCRVVNTMSRSDLAADQLLEAQHRTLQQGFRRLILDLAKAYQYSHHDARNEASVELCSKITKLVDDGELPYLPLV